MTQAIKAVTTTCWQHVRMPPGPRCASAVGKWREWWRGSLGPCRRQHMPQPVHSITLPLIVPACEAETISHCYSLWWGHKSHNKRKKEKKTQIAVKSLATELDFFPPHRLFMCAANSKRQRYCWRLPFPVPEYRSTYFHTLSVVQWKWSLGSGVLFPQTIAGSVQNRRGTLGS